MEGYGGMARVFKNDKRIMNTRLKVVWICEFSDARVRSKIRKSKFYYRDIIKRIFGKSISIHDYGVWNTNAIHEFEHINDIDLTVILEARGISKKVQKFSLNGINYVCFRSEEDHLLPYIKERLTNNKKHSYKKNRLLISSLIKEITPDVVHVIGAENPKYSTSILDVPANIPCVIELQTLMSAPDFLDNYPINKDLYYYRVRWERMVIQRADYIGSSAQYFKDIIRKEIKSDSVFLNMSLAVGQDIDETEVKKEYDFVYFAANINKACDLAIESFGIVCHKHPELTLNISGGYDISYKRMMEKRLQELGICDNVFITGSQPTHKDVLKQIKKSRFAVLPLKVDLVSGTIREAMACGLPVVTTITPATPNLNKVRESVLLSEKGDFQAMANNMIRLVEDEPFANKLKSNALETVREKYSNERFMQLWRKAYYEIVENYRNGTPFSDDVISK